MGGQNTRFVAVRQVTPHSQALISLQASTLKKLNCFGKNTFYSHNVRRFTQCFIVTFSVLQCNCAFRQTKFSYLAIRSCYTTSDGVCYTTHICKLGICTIIICLVPLLPVPSVASHCALLCLLTHPSSMLRPLSEKLINVFSQTAPSIIAFSRHRYKL